MIGFFVGFAISWGFEMVKEYKEYRKKNEKK